MTCWSNTLCASALLALLTAGCESAAPMAPEASPVAFATTHGQDDPPFYARVERPFTIHTDEWAAIVFYRPPECVPPTFNLLNLFDIPRAFGCGPLTVRGWAMSKNPDPFAPPYQTSLKGLGAVPVWLVTWSELRAALAGGLTITELEGLSSLLKGTAATFDEMLQPYPARIPSRLVMNAQGTLEDGRRFRLHYTSQDDDSGNDVRSVRIDVW